MQARHKVSYGAGSWALLIAVIGIIFVANYLAKQSFTRLDLTENKQYTLSQSTRELISELPDVVSIRAVISSNIPAPYNQQTREVKDFLQEYETYSQGNISLEILDPVGKPDVQTELSKLGINPVQLPVRGTEQASIINVWSSIYIQYRDRTDTLRNVFTTETLEYDLTSAIYRIIQEEETGVGFLKTDEERELEREFGTLKRSLEKQFEVTEVETDEPGGIDQSIEVLMVLNPFRVTERDLFEIDQYIMHGGNAIFLADGVRVFLQPGQFGSQVPMYAMPLNQGMDKLGGLLSHYGVNREYNLVQDKPFRAYPLLGPLGTEYPLFPVIDMRADYQPEHAVTQGIDHLVFAWASSLQVGDTLNGVEAIELVKTSPGSWVQAGRQLVVDPTKKAMPPLPIEGMGEKQRTLAVLLTGRFESFFAGEPAPAEGDTAEQAEQIDRKDQSPDTNLLVTGCSYFVSDMVPLSSSDLSQNMNFIMGAIEWMTGGYKLSDIKKRKVEARPIQELSRLDVLAAGIIVPLAAPLAVILFGTLRSLVKRTQKKKFLESME